MTGAPDSGEDEAVAALVARAEEIEREALYTVIGRIGEGWTADVRDHGEGSCWRWMGRGTSRPSEPMPAAEQTVIRVARQKWAARTASNDAGG